MPTNLISFRRSAARHLGQTLTPDVAVGLEVAAFATAPTPVDVTRFQPVERDGYRIAVERMADVLMRRLGYAPVALKFVKIIEGSTNVQ